MAPPGPVILPELRLSRAGAPQPASAAMGGLPRVSGRGNEPSEATAAEFQPSAAAPPPPSPPPSSPRANEPPASDNGSFSPKLQPDDYKPSGSAAPSSEAGSAGDEAATGRVGSGSAAAAGVSHYEASRDIITRLEFLRTAEVKASTAGCRAGWPWRLARPLHSQVYAVQPVPLCLAQRRCIPPPAGHHPRGAGGGGGWTRNAGSGAGRQD